ncbi:MAG TPA: hypothetical protein VK567_11280, partial [Bradyrhizobium sp.]|nr:hypothetical protein [Bradyrhizobium sp.]
MLTAITAKTADRLVAPAVGTSVASVWHVRAFSSEVETGSRQENASNRESRAPFRFYRNGKDSSIGRTMSIHPFTSESYSEGDRTEAWQDVLGG